jgi:hypothetical protein
MKRIHFTLLLIVVAVLFACRGGETKADPETNTDNERKTEEKINENQPAPAATAAPDSLGANSASNEILAKIDQHLVSTPVFTAQASGDIVNVSVTIKNTLKDITFQKAIVEVTVLGADGKALRNDFFTIVNIEPGDIETIKLPNSKGASLASHVVKVKSNQLTNGEMVLTGTHFDAGK